MPHEKTTIRVNVEDSERIAAIKDAKDLGSNGRVIRMLLDEYEGRKAST